MLNLLVLYVSMCVGIQRIKVIMFKSARDLGTLDGPLLYGSLDTNFASDVETRRSTT